MSFDPSSSLALRQRLAQAAISLAKQAAIRETKLAIQRQGRRKVWQVPHREIVAMAKEYLAAHPALIEGAKPIVEQWREAAADAQHSLRTCRSTGTDELGTDIFS